MFDRTVNKKNDICIELCSNWTSLVAVEAHLLFGEVVFDQTAHDLLRRPGCADMRGD